MGNTEFRRVKNILQREYEDLLVEPHYRNRLIIKKDFKLPLGKEKRMGSSFEDKVSGDWIHRGSYYQQYAFMGDIYITYLRRKGYMTVYIARSGVFSVPKGHLYGTAGHDLLVTKTGFSDKVDTVLEPFKSDPVYLTDDQLGKILKLYISRPDLFTEIEYSDRKWKNLKHKFRKSNPSLALFMLKDSEM